MTDPTSIGPYEVTERLGQGGMGTVYKVLDSEGRVFALKRLNVSAKDVSHRFKREFRAASALHHHNIVRVFQQLDDPELCFTMEYVRGTDLMRYVYGSSAPTEPVTRPDQFRKVFFALGQILKALDYIHAQGIVHRDLKPDNVLVNHDGVVKITDFGLAKLEESGSFVTALGSVLGTVGYLAPEQIVGQPVDARTDFYALGVMLYQLLSAKLPYPDKDPLAIIHKKVTGAMPPPPSHHNDCLDRRWNNLVMRLIQLKPADRYQGIGDTFAELRALWTSFGDGGTGVGRAAAPAFDSGDLLTRTKGVMTAPALIEREAELAALTALLARTAKGAGGIAIVAGEAGIGKSRLLADARAAGRANGVKVLTAQAKMSAVPFGHFLGPLGNIADQLARWDHKEVRRMVAPDWSVLRLLVPRFNKVAAIRTLPAASPLPPREARDRDLKVLVSLFRELVKRDAIALFFEDVQISDEASHALLMLLAEHLAKPGDAQFLVVATIRTGGIDERNRARRFVARHEAAPRLDLKRLGLAGVAAMIAAMTGDDEGAPLLARRLMPRTEGNPLLVEQTVRGLVENGYLTRQSGRWQVVAGDQEETGDIPLQASKVVTEVEVGIEEALRARLIRLPRRTRQILEFGAVAGRSFRVEVVARAAGLDEGAVLDAFNESMLAGLITEPARADESYAFSHQRIGDVLLSELAPGARRALHEAVGLALEQLGGAPIEELATHFDRGGDAKRSADYLPAAARQHARQFDNEAALECFRRAIEVQRSLAVDQPLTRAAVDRSVGVRLEAVEIAELVGRLDEALEWSREAHELATGAGLEGRQLAARVAEANLRCQRNDYSTANSLAREALVLARATGDPAAEARVHVCLGRIASRTERFEEAEGHYRAALAEHSARASPVDTASSLVNLAVVARKRDRHAEAAALLDRAIEICRTSSNRRGLGKGLLEVGALRLARCEFDAAREPMESALAIDREIGNRRGVAMDLSSLGSLDLTIGDYEAAGRRFLEALAILQELQDQQSEALALVNLGHVRFRSGAPDLAIELYQRAHEIFQRLGHSSGSSEALSSLAAAEIRLGRLADARRHATEAIGFARAVGLREKEAWASLTLARASSDAVAADRAVKLAELAGNRNVLFQALHCQAQVRRRQGDAGAARESLERAVGIIQSLAGGMGEGGKAFLLKPAVLEVYAALGVPSPSEPN